MSGEPTARERNERLMRAYLNGELLAARAFLEDRLAHLFTGLLGKLVNPLAKALYHAIGEAEVRRRVNQQFDVIVAAARDAEALGVAAAGEKWLAKSLETEEVVVRGDRRHPRFADVERLLADGFRERLAAIAPLLAYEGPAATYDDIVRGAYPDPRAPEAVVRGQIAIARRVTAIVQENPKLLHFPAPLVRHLFPIVEDVTRWFEARFASELARVYADASGSDQPATSG